MSTTSSPEERRVGALALQAALDDDLLRMVELQRTSALSVPALRALRYACRDVMRAALRDPAEEGRAR